MVYKIHLVIFIAALCGFLASVRMASEQRIGAGRLTAERIDGVCAYRVEGIRKADSPYRLVYVYDRWGAEEVPSLRVISEQESWIARQVDASAARKGNYYPTTANYGLIIVNKDVVSMVFREQESDRCKGKDLYLRKGASDTYRYVGAISIVFFIYAIVAVILYGFISSMRNRNLG